ncbi:MAG: DsrE family protein [Burkholderiales bacterium]|nr:DsrE family protein [Burkholderiales bacterium]
MVRRALPIAAALAALLILQPAASRAQTPAAERPNKVVFQVSEADPAKWNLTLNNARNVQQSLGADKVAIEVVAYGPGIDMLKLESAAGARVAEAMSNGVAMVACENTMKSRKVGREDMLAGIGYVPAGVVQLMQRQKEGYAYVRP